MEWSDSMWSPFLASKAAMTNAAELVHPVEGAELSLEVDASGTHVGVVLHQWGAAGNSLQVSSW